MGHIVRTLVLVAATLLSGCFSVDLPPLEAPTGLQKLADLSNTTVPLVIETQGHETVTLGYQYLFFLVPLSRVYASHLETDLRLQMSVAGGMRGYRFTNSVETTQSLLKLTIHDVNVDGYDLLFIRKPTSSVTISAQYVVNGVTVRECEESVSASNTAHFAFAAELQHALSEALLQVSYKLLDCAGLTER